MTLMRALFTTVGLALPFSAVCFISNPLRIQPSHRALAVLKADEGSSTAGTTTGYLPAKLASLADKLRACPSDVSRAQALVKLGDEWASLPPSSTPSMSPPPSSSSSSSSLASSSQGDSPRLRRVPGCTALVHLGVELIPVSDDESMATLSDDGGLYEGSTTTTTTTSISTSGGGGGVYPAVDATTTTTTTSPVSTRDNTGASISSSSSSGIGPAATTTTTKHSNKKRWRVGRVVGGADARLSQGLLALLAQGFQGSAVEEVLDVEVALLSQRAGLDTALTPSRTNGLASLLHTLKSLVRDRLLDLNLNQSEEGSSQEVPSQLPPLSDSASSSSSSSAITATEDSLPLSPPLVFAATTTTTTTAAEPTKEDIEEDRVGVLQEAWRSGGAKEEVAVLLSGGVDSSVALRLALEAGYSCRCFYLKIWLEDELSHLNQCPWEEDWAYASAVAEQAGVPIEAVSMHRAYWDTVVAHTISEAKRGRTPNPDVLCNSRVKFGMFYDQIGRHFDKVVTGHYARAAHGGDDVHVGTEGKMRISTTELVRSADPVKDQTYFLSGLSQAQLKRAWFPLGAYTKPEVRALAAKFNLPTKARKDSQGICFLGKLKWGDFLSHYIPDQPGAVVELGSMLAVGTHRGLHFHTVGQRKGLGSVIVSSQIYRGPWFVAAKDTATNTLFVSTNFAAAATSSLASSSSAAALSSSSSSSSSAFSSLSPSSSMSSPAPSLTTPRSSRTRGGGCGDVVVFEVEDVNWISGHPPRNLCDYSEEEEEEQQVDGNGDDGTGGSSGSSSSSSSSGVSRGTGLELVVQIRHGPRSHVASIWSLRSGEGSGSGIGGDGGGSEGGGSDIGGEKRRVRVAVGESVGALAAGQYAAFYARRRIPTSTDLTATTSTTVTSITTGTSDTGIDGTTSYGENEVGVGDAGEWVEVCLGSGVICDQSPEDLGALIDKAAAATAAAAAAVVVPTERRQDGCGLGVLASGSMPK